MSKKNGISLNVSSYFYIYSIMNMDVDEMQSNAQEVSDMLKVLSSENRLMLICQLVDGEKSVGELAKRLDMRPAAVSQQLALRKDRVVSTRKVAQTVYYSVSRTDVRELIEFLYDTYCGDKSRNGEGVSK